MINFNRSAVCTLLLAASTLTVSGNAQSDVRTAHSNLVSETASFFTPNVLDGRVEAIAIEGDTVYVGGTFTQIQVALDGEIINQPYLFAYSKSTGAFIRDFDPDLNNEVRALQTTGEGTGIFAGGNFTVVNGQTNRRGLVKLDNFGDRVIGFSVRPDGRISSMDRSGDTLYLGGNFTSIGPVEIEYLAAVNTTTGELRSDVNFDFDGVFSTTRVNGSPSVDILEVSSDGDVMVIAGNFETINGINRERLAVIELDNQARLSTWNTNVFDSTCPSTRVPQYINGVDIAPDDSYFITGTTGGLRAGDPACDTILRFDFGNLTDTDAQPIWENHTGRDSVFEVAASEHAIYTGGHFRWLNNVQGRDNEGPGAVQRAGLAALDPLNGLPLLNWQSDRNPRGVGVFALEVEPEGLYIGDDTEFLNGIRAERFKFLPITTNTIVQPERPTLPADIFRVEAATLSSFLFTGSQFRFGMDISNNDWNDARGAMILGGQIFHGDNDGRMYVRSLVDDNVGPRTEVNLFGLTDNEWDINDIGGMFFDYDQSRVYYTQENDSRLYWRAFTPSGPLFGDDEHVADGQSDIPWGSVQGMDVIDGQLYFGLTDGNLYRSDIIGASPVSGTTELVNGGSWDNPFLAFSSGTTELTPTNDSDLEFEAVGNAAGTSFRRFEFLVAAGEPVDVRVAWEDANAQVNVFLRDANNQLVDSDGNDFGSSPKYLSAPAGDGGTYTVAVNVVEGSTAYTVTINPESVPEIPEPLADFEFSSGGDPDNGRFQSFNFDVVAGELVEANITWDDSNADVRVFLRDESNNQVDRVTDGIGSADLSAIAETSGQWSVAVLVREGSVNYEALINTTTDFEVPEALADFEFSSNGDPDNGRFQAFNFDVVAGDLIDLSVIWDNSNADVAVFLRDETNTQIDRNTDGVGSAALSTVAQSTGQWSVAVAVREGSVNYDVLVDVTTDDAPPPVATNIALDGVASQSSTAFGGSAARAIDGSTNGRFSDNSVTHTADTNQPQWEVQLSQLSTIETIVVYNRTDCCTSRLTNYTVSILDANGATVFSRDFNQEPDPSTSIDIGGITGSTVRVQLIGSGFLSLAEVEVMGFAQ